MKKGLSILALLIFGNASAAEWVHIGNNADGGDSFVDRLSIKKNGSIVTLNVLVNNNSRSEYPSDVTATSFDCEEKSMKLISIQTYGMADA